MLCNVTEDSLVVSFGVWGRVDGEGFGVWFLVVGVNCW